MWKTNISAGGGNTAGMRPVTAPSAGGGAAGPGGWEPDILWLLGLLIGEVLVAGFLSRHLLGG